MLLKIRRRKRIITNENRFNKHTASIQKFVRRKYVRKRQMRKKKLLVKRIFVRKKGSKRGSKKFPKYVLRRKRIFYWVKKKKKNRKN